MTLNSALKLLNNQNSVLKYENWGQIVTLNSALKLNQNSVLNYENWGHMMTSTWKNITFSQSKPFRFLHIQNSLLCIFGIQDLNVNCQI